MKSEQRFRELTTRKEEQMALEHYGARKKKNGPGETAVERGPYARKKKVK